MAKARNLFDACKGGKLDTVKKLVESKQAFPSSAIDSRCNDFTALHHAAANGHLRIVQYLVGKNCDLNVQDSYHGKTPLHYAAENGHLAVVQFLAKKDECSFDAKSTTGKTPMKYASDNGHGEIAAFLAEHSAKKKREEEAALTPKSSNKAGAIELTDDHLSSLTSQLTPHSAKWKLIGTHLGFRPGELDNIQGSATHGTPEIYLSKLLEVWLQWAPGDTRGSKSIATLGALQAAVRKAGLGRVAAQLTASTDE